MEMKLATSIWNYYKRSSIRYNLKHSLKAEKSFLNRQRKGENEERYSLSVNEGCAAKPTLEGDCISCMPFAQLFTTNFGNAP